MIKRIVEISSPSYLRLDHQQLTVVRDNIEVGTIPVEDLGVLIIDHPGVSYTQALLAACFENNVVVVLCDAKHLPCALLLPLAGHSLHAKTLRAQIAASQPVQKRLWQVIIQNKIREQAGVLRSLVLDDHPLPAFAAKVKSGDPDNIEAQAARIYWGKLFGSDFRRDRDMNGVNALLNYGYAVLRAAVARAVVGAGLSPALGIHHCNQYDDLALADDLMEPLRPLVDLKVHAICQNFTEPDVNKETKAALLELLTWNCRWDEKRVPLLTALSYYAAGVRAVLCDGVKSTPVPGI
jgi:CRISPR-associated protein Cas1